MGDINQDDIDKLLADAVGGGYSGATERAPEAAEPATPPEAGGAVGQDDIDALFASLGDSSSDAPAAPSPPPEPGKPQAESTDEMGIADQDAIDALFASIGSMEQPAEAPAPEPEPEGQIQAAPPKAEAAAPVPEPVREETITDHSDLAALIDSLDADAEKEISGAGSASSRDEDEDGLNELLSAIADKTPPPPGTPPAAASDTVRVDTVDMDELLRQISSAAPPEAELPSAKRPQPELSSGGPSEGPDATAVLPKPIFPEPASAAASVPGQAPVSAAMPPLAPQAAALPHPAVPENMAIMAGAGEVESMAGQISGMIGQLAEKAQRYMQAWIASDAEAKNLRSRLLAEERLLATLGSEKDAFNAEAGRLRASLAKAEGEKLAVEEARRNGESSLQARIREVESRAAILDSEVESLKVELTRTRTQATGVDIESRRARFEAERLRNEVEAERMERLRMQRALENREKEFQAVQAQAAGQASSLFIDELHRLVRRLESELDARTSGAHEALHQLDRLDLPESMVPVAANLRAALMRAIGSGADDADDAIKSLGREAARVQGPQALDPGKPEMLSFETALSTYNLGSALDVAGALLREFKTTPGGLMRRVYQCPALRRPEVAEHLLNLARLLEGLRTVQESADRTRGRESAESEVFYVQMFDFLHNLVRLKIVTRLSGDPWRLFLDLRGRFSFVTSDKQWAEYRDGVLNSAKADS